VLPAAASLKKQGANNGATTAFLISTPESGVDSIALTYALLDPIMTVARPVAAFATAAVAGLAENVFGHGAENNQPVPDLSCPIDGCCDGTDCSPEEHRNHHTLWEKSVAGLGFALGELWSDIASWFFVGLILAGGITVLVPGDLMTRYLGGGLDSMLIMLVAGIPMYICATASTPVAAALILKGVSPGAALVFLLVGPATNITSLTVVVKILGKRATALYLSSLALCGVAFGLLVDRVYLAFSLSPQAMAGQAAELVPHWAQLMGAFLLLALSMGPCWRALRSLSGKHKRHGHETDGHVHGDSGSRVLPASQEACGCGHGGCPSSGKGSDGPA
jgi:uncharacterized membrane protein YraQ (UPF0718 family)